MAAPGVEVDPFMVHIHAARAEQRRQGRIEVDDMVSPAAGTVETLHRYPVKSMLGELPQSLPVVPHGISGDRGWAVLDVATGKVVSAKRPNLWRSLLLCSARTTGSAAPSVEVAFPDGTVCDVRDAEASRRLSQ